MKFIEHKFDEVIPTATYLVAQYLESEDEPFGFMIYSGSSITLNQRYFEPNYRYYLLTEKTNYITYSL